MKIMKIILCGLLCIGILSGCQKDNLQFINDQLIVELGTPIIQDATCYLAMELSEEEKKDIQDHAKVIVEGLDDTYGQVGEYDAKITYQGSSHNFKIVVKDTVSPIINGPSILYTSLNQTINYQDHYQITDQLLKDVHFDDRHVQYNQTGEYPLYITASDENHQIKKEVIVKVGQQAKSLPNQIKLDVPYYNQLDVNAPNGCEATALYMALQYKKKVDISLKDFISKQPIGETPYLGFAGNPFEKSRHSYDYYTIYPSALAQFGQTYQPCFDISGYSLDDIKRELSEDHPVLVWLTGGLQDARLKNMYYGQVISNLHIVLLTGYDEMKQIFDLLDPFDQTQTEISYQQFEKIYQHMQKAMSVC